MIVSLIQVVTIGLFLPSNKGTKSLKHTRFLVDIRAAIDEPHVDRMAMMCGLILRAAIRTPKQTDGSIGNRCVGGNPSPCIRSLCGRESRMYHDENPESTIAGWEARE